MLTKQEIFGPFFPKKDCFLSLFDQTVAGGALGQAGRSQRGAGHDAIHSTVTDFAKFRG